MRGPHSGRTAAPERACMLSEEVSLSGVVVFLLLDYSHWMAWQPPMSLRLFYCREICPFPGAQCGMSSPLFSVLLMTHYSLAAAMLPIPWPSLCPCYGQCMHPPSQRSCGTRLECWYVLPRSLCLCQHGFRCSCRVSTALLPRFEPDRGGILQDQGIHLPQWRCRHRWWWDCVWHVHGYGCYYAKWCCRVFHTWWLLLISSHTISLPSICIHESM